jgi:hypothetical protein
LFPKLLVVLEEEEEENHDARFISNLRIFEEEGLMN